jgi:predicted metalloprotease
MGRADEVTIGDEMDLNENADLDTSQVEDSRGGGGGGRFGGGGFGGLPIPIGGKIGTILTVVVVLGMLFAGGTFGKSLLGGDSGSSQGDNTSLNQKCATSNPDRFSDTDCRNVLYVNSIQAYWQSALPQTFGKQYSKAPTRFFSGGVNTGCGQADSGVGPFYCPADDRVYIDLTFYNELASRFGAKGEFAQPYVLAHEYGHHIQDLLGTEAQMRRAQQRDPNNANQYSVMLELQADCYAGVWTHHATETKSAGGQALFNNVTEQDIQEALTAAAAVGDDAIQKKMGSGVDESKFTHGSSADRQKWFSQGYQAGDPKSCDTFGNGV